MSNLNYQAISKCITKQDDGVLINIEVKPGSKTIGIEGIDEWRECIEVRIKARAEKGRANKELIQLLASLLSLPSSNFLIIKGERTRRKSVKVLGLGEKELCMKLRDAIEGKIDHR